MCPEEPPAETMNVERLEVAEKGEGQAGELVPPRAGLLIHTAAGNPAPAALTAGAERERHPLNQEHRPNQVWMGRKGLRRRRTALASPWRAVRTIWKEKLNFGNHHSETTYVKLPNALLLLWGLFATHFKFHVFPCHPHIS